MSGDLINSADEKILIPGLEGEGTGIAASRLDEVVPGLNYKNTKTQGLYRVTAIATHSETGEHMVVYSAFKVDDKQWVRPLDLFKAKFEGPVTFDQ